MEYRRRRSGGKKADKESFGFGRALLLLLLFGAAAYLILGTGVGKKLKEGYAASLLQSCRGNIADAQETAAPIDFDELPQSGPTPSTTDMEQAVTVELPEAELYMIQYGFYSDEELCEEAAAPLRDMGAAGFGYNDNGDIRLILAAFRDEESAESVRESLAQQGYECIVHKVSRSGVSLLVTAGKSDLETIRGAFSYAEELTDEISSLALSFDADEMSVEAGAESLAEIRRKAQRADEGINSFSDSSETIGMLHQYYSKVLEMLGEIDFESSSKAGFSSLIKRAQIGSFLYYCVLLDNIGGGN